MANRLISGWRQVTKRSLAHWRLLSSVVFGVLLASAMMAGTVVYFDALKELALKQALGKRSASELDIIVQGRSSPVSFQQYERFRAAVDRQIDARVGWMVTDRIRVGKTPTLFLTTPGNEHLAGDDNARAYLAFAPRLPEHIDILPGGRLPQAQRLNPPGGPPELEAIIPSEAAQLFGVGVRDRLVVVLPGTSDSLRATLVISGVFERRDPQEDIWFLEQRVLQEATGPSFRTAPLYIAEEAFLGVIGPYFRRTEATYAWLLPVDTGRLTARNADRARRGMDTMNANLAATVSAYRQTTALDNVIREYDRRLFFNKLPMFVVLVLIAVVILYYVTTLSSLLVEDRRSEVALLRSRGASSGQILAVFALEGITIVVLAAVAAPVLAAMVVSVLGYTPAFSDLTGGESLRVSLSGGAYLMSSIGGVLSFVALMVPAAQASRIGMTRHRQEAARPSTLPAFQRYYADVFLLVVSIFLFRQLSEQGSVVATRLFGDILVDQLLLAVPGLVLIASAMVLLRLFPLIMGLASRLSSSWMPVGLTMGLWQMARNPTHYARLSLLLILTAGLGIFASSFGATLERSFTERVLYSVGADVRVDRVSSRLVSVGTTRWSIKCQGCITVPRQVQSPESALMRQFADVPGIERASPVLRVGGRDLSKFYGESFEMLAMDPESFTEVAWSREDFAGESIDTLLRSLVPEDVVEGIVLPYEATTLGVRLKADGAHPTVRLTARIMNAQRRYSTYTFGTLTSGDWTVLETSLGFGSRQSLESSRPMTLVSLSLHETGNRLLRAGSILLDEITVTTEAGETISVDGFDNAAQWSLLRASSESNGDALSGAGTPDGSSSVLFSWSDGRPRVAHGIAYGRMPSALPVLASKSFAKATGHAEGETFNVSLSGHDVPVRMAAVVDLFPTMTAPDKRYIVADLTSVLHYANTGSILSELRPNEAWLSTADGADSGALVQGLESVENFTTGPIHITADRLAESRVDALVEAGWRSLLFVAFSAVLILSGFGFLVHAYVSFRNRQLQISLLRTVGFSMRQLVMMVWLEQVLVIAVGLALGTWMGGRLGAIIMPFLGHDDWGGQVMPPFVIEVNWGALLATYAAMVIVFALIILGATWLIHRMSLQRILRLGEL